MLRECIAETQRTLTILEVDGVDFVGHGGGAHLEFEGALREVTNRDVGPHVAREANEDGVEQRQVVVELCHLIVWLNLGGVGIEVQVEGLWVVAYFVKE